MFYLNKEKTIFHYDIKVYHGFYEKRKGEVEKDREEFVEIVYKKEKGGRRRGGDGIQGRERPWAWRAAR